MNLFAPAPELDVAAEPPTPAGYGHMRARPGLTLVALHTSMKSALLFGLVEQMHATHAQRSSTRDEGPADRAANSDATEKKRTQEHHPRNEDAPNCSSHSAPASRFGFCDGFVQLVLRPPRAVGATHLTEVTSGRIPPRTGGAPTRDGVGRFDAFPWLLTSRAAPRGSTRCLWETGLVKHGLAGCAAGPLGRHQDLLLACTTILSC